MYKKRVNEQIGKLQKQSVQHHRYSQPSFVN